MGNGRMLVMALLVLVVVGGALLVLLRDDPEVPNVSTAPVQMPGANRPPALEPEPVPEQAPEPEPAAPLVVAPEPEPVAPAAPALPPLHASDPAARGALADLGVATLVPAETSDLLSRAAVAVENTSRGVLPSAALAFLAPEGSFPVQRVDGELRMDPAGYRRYNRVVSDVTALDPAEVAARVERFEPLLAQALGQLGIRDRSPVAVLRGAIDQVLAAPVVRGPVALEQPSVAYRYADPALEDLPPVHKQMLRMGPAHTERLQAWLTRLRDALPEE